MAAPLGSATRRWLPLYLQQGIRKVVWVRTNRLTDASLQACHFVWLRLTRGPPLVGPVSRVFDQESLCRASSGRARDAPERVTSSTLETAGRMTMFPWHQSLVLACATEPSQWEYSTRPLGLQSQSQLEIMGGPPLVVPPHGSSRSVGWRLFRAAPAKTKTQ